MEGGTMTGDLRALGLAEDVRGGQLATGDLVRSYRPGTGSILETGTVRFLDVVSIGGRYAVLSYPDRVVRTWLPDDGSYERVAPEHG
jgi:hypothetical protein